MKNREILLESDKVEEQGRSLYMSKRGDQYFIEQFLVKELGMAPKDSKKSKVVLYNASELNRRVLLYKDVVKRNLSNDKMK